MTRFLFFCFFLFTIFPNLAYTFPVAGKFGTQTKVIVGQGSDVDPINGIGGLDGLDTGDGRIIQFSAINDSNIMTPVGDGSYMATFFFTPGQLIPPYRFLILTDTTLPITSSKVINEDNYSFEKDGTFYGGDFNTFGRASFALPISSDFTSESYVVYNDWSSQAVFGQVAGSLSSFGGQQLIANQNDTSPVNNPFNMRAGAAETVAVFGWSYASNLDALGLGVQDVETEDSASSGYGFKIFRAGPFTIGFPDATPVFTDITSKVTEGKNFWVGGKQSGQSLSLSNEHYIFDTGLIGSRLYLYTVQAFDAYGMSTQNGFTASDALQPSGNRSAGANTGLIDVIFIVMDFNRKKVLNKNGKGWVYLTPIVNGKLLFNHKIHSPILAVTTGAGG